MPTEPLVVDDLLDPISPDQPAGVNLRWEPEWDRIKEARRADDGLEAGKWAKKEQKAADWRRVQDLASAMLQKRSKDLQLAMWLTEANIKLHGFAGLREGLRLTRELIVRYWDQGLFPLIERAEDDKDDLEARAGPLQWLNDKLVDSITAIPITVRMDQGQDYNFIEVQEARRVGSEASCRTADGDVDSNKRKKYDEAIAAGRIPMEQLERAIKETRRAGYEVFSSDFEQTYQEFKALEKVIDEKFGDQAPNLAACRSSFNEMREEISKILERKRKEEPDSAPAPESAPSSRTGAEDPVVVRFPLSLPSMQGSQVPGSSWSDAEMLIRSGQVDKGLAEMIRLAANETSGRNRFQRKLLLAEVCLSSQREFLARTILEELAEQIDKFQLELWESSELVGSVWSRLYKLYRKSESGSSDADLARKLYERLCRLDPWQALACGEA